MFKYWLFLSCNFGNKRVESNSIRWGLKMKRLIPLFILLVITIVSGCTVPPPDKPYIIDANTDRNFGVAGENIDVVVTVKNPTTIDFNGNVLIKADMPRCFNMNSVTVGTTRVDGYLNIITVEAGKTNSALMTMHIPERNEQNCYQPSNHKLSIFVLQGEKVLSTTEIDFALFERR